MRTRRIGSWLISAVEWLRSSPRRVWWTTFALVTVLSGLWGIANPPFAAPDEPAHVKRAVALDHGELTGETASRRLRRELVGAGNQPGRACARGSARSDPACFAFKPDISASCLSSGDPAATPIRLTTAGRHPPAYYGVVGLVSLVYPPGWGPCTSCASSALS